VDQKIAFADLPFDQFVEFSEKFAYVLGLHVE